MVEEGNQMSTNLVYVNPDDSSCSKINARGTAGPGPVNSVTARFGILTKETRNSDKTDVVT